jgi:outer membrane protein assembly factor BamB
MTRSHLLGLVWICISCPAFGADVALEQVISREHPQFNAAQAKLAVGGDGLVYLGSIGPDNTAYVLRMTREGGDKYGAAVTYALANAAANKDGVLATANGHFAHKVALYDRTFKPSAEAADFLVGDHVGWDAPPHVEAGESGDFYGVDQHRDRILRISPLGKVIKAYPISRQPEGHAGLIDDFRVCEALEAFYIVTRQGPLRVVGFDGRLRWTTPHRIGVSHLGVQGGYDVDRQGNLYVVEQRAGKVVKLNAEGQPAGEITLQIPEFPPNPQSHEGTITGLAIVGDEFLLKRWDATKLFERYDLASGAFQGAVASDHERLAVTYPSDVWTAGEPIDFHIDFHSPRRNTQPKWRVWIRPLSSIDYRELPVENGKVHVPQDLGGVYQIKVSPEVQPWERGKASEYLVRGWVEVRAPGAKGSLSVLTPASRIHFGRGEEIPISVLARGTDAAPVEATVKLTYAGRDLAASQVSVTPGKVLQFNLPRQCTSGLRAGKYQLIASAPGLTSVAQSLVIGEGASELPFLRLRHGDYGPTYPSADAWNAPDVVAAHVAREQRLGFNTFVDRIGTHTQIGALHWDSQSKAQLDDFARRLEADPLAAAPETMQSVSPLLQVMAAYSAHDMKQMAILLYMDAGLPLGGPGFDNRKPEKMAEDLQTVTKALVSYPAFRGWSWHANWWIFEQRGSAAATSTEEKAAYEGALKTAKETGQWSEVLDTVSQRRLGFAVEAQEFFKNALDQVAPDERLIAASAGTYRNVEAYPPISFQNVEEVDLQGQFEQIFLPHFPAHAVDFYRRPGKPVWGHPEIWNDAGTGGQVLPELFSMLMRSPDGLGPSGAVPAWTGQTGIVEDPRNAHFGAASIFRAMNNVLRRYGGWIGTLENDDRVAIVGSPRQFKIDAWGQVMGIHFARVMEAYVSCLAAHHPASIVFVDDIEPETLANYQAVLVVDQWVEMAPMLKTALENAKAAGAQVFYDGTCREALMQGFTPLGISFDKFEKDKHPASDDAAYYRFPKYVLQNLPALTKALDEAAAPPAKVANPEVWVSQLKSGEGRYLFVVNNTSVPLEPSQMWRTSLHVASLLPVTERVEFTAPATAVYDVFAMKQVAPQQNALAVDLCDVPARLYAFLPAAIGSVALEGPSRVAAGQPLPWHVAVVDDDGKAIAASVPLRVRFVDGEGNVLDEEYPVATSRGAQGEFVAPLNAPGDLRLEATELISGRSAHLEINATPPAAPLSLETFHGDTQPAALDRASQASKVLLEPTELEFGPHLRDIVLSPDGKIAVINAMNWDHNLYGIDAATGRLLWRNKLGNYFAFAPKTLADGFAVQGFDYSTAEGYHLYRTNREGEPQGRFALYGLPRRLPHRFVPGLFSDREDPVNNFAAASDGSWIASAGDLGLAVWDANGELLWKRDWWKDARRPARLAAFGRDVLLAAQDMQFVAHDARSGAVLWNHDLAPTGLIREIAVSGDGQTAAVLSTTDGGRIFVLQGGKLVNTLAAGGDDLDISGDGSRIIAVDSNQLKFFTREGGLEWSFAGDDRLRNPRMRSDGARLAVSSELGTVYVLDESGKLLHEQDNVALTAPAWMPEGDLLLANWMGRVSRLGDDFQPKWSVRLQAANTDVKASLAANENLPTARIKDWGNASAQPLPLMPNLLSESKALIQFVAEGSPHIQLVRGAEALTDGSPQPPAEPWLDWGDINWFAEANPNTYLLLDTFRTQLRVRAITLVEDSSRSDSWLRDASLEYWDAETEQWIHVQPLLSDAAVHTHELTRPIEAARFRIVIPRGFYSNLRLAEIVLHGETLGASHPDVIARRPVGVLFDESEEFKDIYPYADRWSFQLQDAYSGGRFLKVNANQTIAPAFIPFYGHAVPSWDWEIAEHPQPGQYRWAQWTWKALTPEVTGATVQLGGLRLHAGQVSGEAHLPAHEVAKTINGEWQTVRVDLWEVLKKPANIQTLYLSAVGGPVGFDQIVLARSEAEFHQMESRDPAKRSDKK